MSEIVMLTATHPLPRAALSTFEDVADMFGCGLDIHAPEDYPEHDVKLTWVIAADEMDAMEVALHRAAEAENVNLPALAWQDVPQNVDWQAQVAASFPPLAMGQFYITRNNEAVPAGQIGLRIPANQAFGSGEHATTAGCLALFEHLYMESNTAAPAKILDMGAGSGLLAMAAAKIYPEAVNVATDIDATSVKICAENCADNDVSQIICAAGDGFNLPEVQDNAPFDLIFANILMNPLLGMAEEMVAALATDGVVILSGFTPEQFPRISEKYVGLGLTPITHTQQRQDTSASQGIPAEWIAAAFRK